MSKVYQASLDRIPLIAKRLQKLQRDCAFTAADLLSGIIFLAGGNEDAFTGALEEGQLLVDGYYGENEVYRVGGKLVGAKELLKTEVPKEKETA